MRFVLRTAGAVILACLLTEQSGIGQGAPSIVLPGSELGPFGREVELPRHDDDSGFGRLIALSGDTALVAGTDIVYVFDRAAGGDWLESLPIIAPTAAVNFGAAVDLDGRTAIVGASGAAYIFRRRPNGVWRELATLTPDDGHPAFGGSVAIDGESAIVGATVGPALLRGGAYVFQRSGFGLQLWEQIARLDPSVAPFGPPIAGVRGVDLSGQTAIVAPADGRADVLVYSRDVGGPNGWEVVRTIVGGAGVESVCCTVAIEHETAVVGNVSDFLIVGAARVVERNEGGADAWGQVARYLEWFASPPGDVTDVAVSRDTVALKYRSTIPSLVRTNEVHLLARNQGAPHGWGAVTKLLLPAIGSLPAAISISGDTLLFAVPVPDSLDPTTTHVSVIALTSDLDGDGLRNDVDACVRDPLNNVTAHCRRQSAAYPTLDHLITQTPFSISAPQANRRVLSATYTNISDAPIRNPFFEVTEINGRNLLRNSDEGPAGVGATLSPDIGDGVLSPGESMKVDFVIQYRSRRAPLTFSVAFRGEVVN